MSKRAALLVPVTIIAVLVVDQATKAYVRASMTVGQSHPVVPDLFWFTRVQNEGAAFGLFAGRQWLLALIAAVVVVVIGYVLVRKAPQSTRANVSLALISAGAVGNLIDRVVLGSVTDFFDLGWFPVFNVADIALDVGVALLVWWLLFAPEHRHEHHAEHAVAAGPADDGELS